MGPKPPALRPTTRYCAPTEARYNLAMKTLALLAPLVVAACFMQGSNEQELRTRVPGTWVGTSPDGVKLTMVLKEDGTGEVNGHAGTWEIKIGRILLSDGEHLVPCDLSGDELSCHTPEGDLVLTRGPAGAVAEAPAAAEEKPPAAPAKPFTPEKTVPGQPFIAPANGPIGGASFTMPDGWTHSVVTASGQKVHMLQSSGVDSASITIARLEGQALPSRERVAQVIASYTAGQHEVVLEPEDVDLAGQAAARAILKHEASEYYGAVVGGKDVIFVVVGQYPADKAEAMRPVVETVLGSFRASP